MNRHTTVIRRRLCARPCALNAALVVSLLGLLPASSLAAEPEPATVEAAPGAPGASGVSGASAEPVTLTLEQGLERLDAQNLTLAQARARASEARGVVRQAMAAFLPTLGVSGSYLRNSESATLALGSVLDAIEKGLATIAPKPVQLDRSQVPAATVIQPLESFSALASVRIPVFAAHAYPDALAASEAAKATEASAHAVRLTLRSTLLQAAWWSGATEEMAAAAERALAVAQEHERSAARAVEAGTAAPLARLQAQTDAVRRESDLTRARAERQRAWLALGVLLGEATPMRLALPEEPRVPAESIDTRRAAGLERRPELQAFASSMRAAQWQLDSAWWRLAPQLSVSGAAFASSVAYVTGEQVGWRASVDLTWTLYDGGLRYGKRLQAEGQLASARAGLAAQRLEVSQQVQDSSRDLTVAQERLRLAQRQKELAVEVAASAKRSFEAGLASSLDVLDANDRLYQADVGLADARARLGMASAALARATGALL